MAGHPIDRDKFWRKALEHGLETCAQIAKKSRVCEKTVWSALKGRPVQRKTRLKLAQAIGLPDDREILARSGLDEDGDDELQDFSTVLDSAIIEKRALQDVKLVLGVRALSDALLTGKNVPSFADCLRGSHLWTPVDDGHKDYPFQRGMRFNHFVQLALIVSLDTHDQANLICYRRTPRSHVPSQVHTVGPSILFGCSSLVHVDRSKHAKSALDRWLETTRNPVAAEKQLLRQEKPVLLELAARKINLVGKSCRITPLGIITRDERKESFKRVYSQFVFHVVLRSVPEKRIDLFVRLIDAHGLELARLPDVIKPEEVFLGENGRRNTMDIVAWKALHSDDDAIQFERTVFRRSFNIA